MKLLATLLILALPIAQAPGTSASPAEGPPAWAYPENPPGSKAVPDDGSLRHVPDSNVTYTLTQVRDLFAAPDWHPGDHPAMPEVVSHGRRPDLYACGFCHRADGPGGSENASLAGLPVEYIVRQMAEFKSGARSSSLPERLPPKAMVSVSKAATSAEIEEAAAYFSGLKPKSNIRVIEASMVPATYVTGWHLAAVEGGIQEPIGQRIIEIPTDSERFESRDSRAKFIAYVPIGSIRKGELLVKDGAAGKTVPCAGCHGADLKGLGAIPRLAGRSPSYLVRQLYDFKHGTRAGLGSALMLPTVANLEVDDMISIAAYAASLTP